MIEWIAIASFAAAVGVETSETPSSWGPVPARIKVAWDDLSVGGKLHRMRWLMDLSQEEMASKIGVTQGLITALETGRRKPTRSTLLAYIATTGARLTPEEIDPTVPPPGVRRGSIEPVPGLGPSDLKRIRKRLGLTQSEMAKRIGVTQAQISSLERGSRNLTERTAARYLELLSEGGNQ
jgi:transcriptional regulator with XRE-family HTH domain